MRLTLTSLLVILNTILWGFGIFYPVIPIKALPFSWSRRQSQRMLNWISEMWGAWNWEIAQKVYGIDIEVQGMDNPAISYDKSYLIICNHQAYTDIFVLLSAFNRRIPWLKFFIKQELIWFPILGLCWWALDYPFVKRYSKEQIKNNPKLAGKDLASVREACEKYKLIPTTILNFPEGHRRTPERMAKEGDPNLYRHLLKPRAGGTSVALSILKDVLEGVLDITVVYPEDRSSFKDLMEGNIRKVKVIVEFIPLSEVPVVEDASQASKSKAMQDWMNERWSKKEALIEQELKTLSA